MANETHVVAVATHFKQLSVVTEKALTQVTNIIWILGLGLDGIILPVQALNHACLSRH